ncbi:hypothetical protein [Yersinia aleksiciae]
MGQIYRYFPSKNAIPLGPHLFPFLKPLFRLCSYACVTCIPRHLFGK